MKRFILNILLKQAGKKRMQKIFESLYQIGLSGMNYGNGANFKESGELNVLKIIREKLAKEKNLTIFDVGGNVGDYSRSISDFFDDNIIIHSFEPSKKTFEIFLKSTSGIANIIPNNLGLSDRESNQTLYTNADASGLASVYKRNLEHFGISMNQTETVKLSTIDNYCDRNKINHIHFLKLDIEGHELDAMKGALRMINNKKIDFIQFEFGGCNIDSRTYFQDFYYLLRDKYRIYRVVKDGLVEILQYKETSEIFITINYLAIKID